jgi:ubiquinone/menaquinone biosynthesis C-methylase UbiE
MRDTTLDKEVQLWQEKLFSRSIRRTRKLERMEELIGSTNNFHCLEISAGDGIISSHLRSLGGSWKTAVAHKEAADSLGYSISETITALEDSTLPFEDNTFDRLVIVDTLKEFGDDYEFLHECHRVLKTDGWVIISETRRAPLSIVAFLRRIMGLMPISRGSARNGYKVSELFTSLKDGFDVPETITYCNPLLESLAVIGEFFQRIGAGSSYYWLVKENAGAGELHRFRSLYSIAALFYPLYWLLSIFEFLPGHRILVKSRRRHWRPRLQPKLIDGRSIAEAAINTKIGTAAPF